MSKLKFAGRNWDARNWTREQKIQWQEKTFELGYSWDGEGVHYLDSPYYTTNKDGSLYRSDVSYHFSESSGELLNFEDMFPEGKEDEKLDVVKEITKLFSESLLEEGVSDEDEQSFEGLVQVRKLRCGEGFVLNKLSEEQKVFIKENIPTYTDETVSDIHDIVFWNDRDQNLFGSFGCLGNGKEVSFNDLFQYEDELCSVQ